MLLYNHLLLLLTVQGLFCFIGRAEDRVPRNTFINNRIQNKKKVDLKSVQRNEQENSGTRFKRNYGTDALLLQPREDEISEKKKHNSSGQKIEEPDFGGKRLKRSMGQQMEEFDFGHKPKHSIGQKVKEIGFGHHKKHHVGQEVEEIGFGHQRKHPVWQNVEGIDFGHKKKHPVGQEVEEIGFGHQRKHPVWQDVEGINFGHKKKHQMGQEVEEIGFGNHKKHHVGQEEKEINFGHRKNHPMGQEVEKIGFGHQKKHPMGQEVEEIDFGHQKKYPIGQEIEEIGFGHQKKHPIGQEIEKIDFGHKKKHPIGQEIEEIGFGHQEKHPMGQEVEEIDFGHQKKYPIGQEIEEIGFGHKKKHPVGQEIEEIGFGHKKKHPIGQEVEEIGFGHQKKHPIGQEVEEIDFGHKKKHPVGQEVEEIDFGHKKKHPIGQEVEEIDFGHQKKHPMGQEVEEIDFGHKKKHPIGQEVEEIDFGHQKKYPVGQEVEEIDFGHQKKHPVGQEEEEIGFGDKKKHPMGQEEEEMDFPSGPEYSVSQSEQENNYGDDSKPVTGQVEEEMDFPSGPEYSGSQSEQENNYGDDSEPLKSQVEEDMDFPSGPEYSGSQSEHEINYGNNSKPVTGQVEEEMVFPSEPEYSGSQSELKINFTDKFKPPSNQIKDTLIFESTPEYFSNKENKSIPSTDEIEIFDYKPKPEDSKDKEMQMEHLENRPTHPEQEGKHGNQTNYSYAQLQEGLNLGFEGKPSGGQGGSIYFPPDEKILGSGGPIFTFSDKNPINGNTEIYESGYSATEGSSVIENQQGHESSGPSSDKIHFPDEDMKMMPEARCTFWNSRYYRTFQNIAFSSDSDCSFSFLQDKNGIYQIVHEKPKCSDESQCSRTLKILYHAKEYLIYYTNKKPNLEINREVQRIPIQLNGFSVLEKSDRIIVALESVNIELTWLKNYHLTITMHNFEAGTAGGLCADNKQSTKIFNSSVGTVEYLEKWKVNDLLHTHSCSLTPTNEFENNVNQEIINHCNQIFDRLPKCQKIRNLDFYKNACIWDYSKCGSTCACTTIQAFIQDCKEETQHVVSTGEWREIAGCSINCPAGKVYSECGPLTEPSCRSFDAKNYAACVEGCFCPEGTILDGDQCIARGTCSCQWKNERYKTGMKVQNKCNTCTCQNGEWICTNFNCGAVCSVTNYFHYRTFDEKRYNFYEACSHYLLHNSNYTVEIKDVPCSENSIEKSVISYTGPGASCGKDFVVTTPQGKIELKKPKGVFKDGNKLSLPTNALGAVIRSVSSSSILVTLPDGIDILWNGMNDIYIEVPPGYSGNNKGLCGTYNKNQKDDFLTPEGDVEDSALNFGRKWSAIEKCPNEVEEIEDACDQNLALKALAEERCRVLLDVFKNCHDHVDVHPFYKNCLFDVCSCQKSYESCLCPVLVDYGNECLRNNINVPGRMAIKECQLDCPNGQTYQACADTCTRSCRDIEFLDGNCVSKCAEGCGCEKGFTLNNEGRCIPVEACPCYHYDQEYKANETRVKDNGKGHLDLCTCINAKWSCKSLPQDPSEKGKLQLAEIKGCDEALNMEYSDCKLPEPTTCKNMHEERLAQKFMKCSTGCVCKKGFVWDSDKELCVRPTDCPCHHGGKSYSEGEEILEDCTSCRCQTGHWACTTHTCKGVCSVWGNSHFKTFDGTLFDFDGACNFLLTGGSISDYESFHIYVDIVSCGSVVSCPRMVTIVVGPPHKEESIVLSKSNPNLITETNLKRIHVRESGFFVIVEILDLGITVRWDKNTRIYVEAHPKWSSKVKGLCGDFNAVDSNDLSVVNMEKSNPSHFADAWRVEPHCRESTEQVDPCKLRPDRETWAIERCSTLKSKLFEQCHSKVPVTPYFERCLTDACGCDSGGDCECLCAVIAAYGEECNQKGVPVKWRSQDLCPVQCERGSEYLPCMSTCPVKTCENQFRDKAISQKCLKETCVEGCEKIQCPPGLILHNSTSNECVPVNSCKTVCLVVNNVTYFEGDLMEQENCHDCYCSHHQKVCIGSPCFTDVPEVSWPQMPVQGGSQTTEIVSVCPNGQVWDNCLVKCDQLCHYSNNDAVEKCYRTNDCLSGCRPDWFMCPPGFFLRNDFTCVAKKDCPCLSRQGFPVKPGEVVEESECEKCQCINNHYECNFVCTPARPPQTITPAPTTNIIIFAHHNTTLIHTSTPATEFAKCPLKEYVSVINGLTHFSASSSADEYSSPDLAKMDVPQGAWKPDPYDVTPYLELDLKKVEPLFGVNVIRVSDNYVTSYQLTYSLNGRHFKVVTNLNGEEEIFPGPYEDEYSVKQIFARPIEARYVRFYPLSWTGQPELKVDVFGCKPFDIGYITTTPLPLIPVECKKPLGINRSFPGLKIRATSSRSDSDPGEISLSEERGWRPLANSKSEWIELDFDDLYEFTGIATKGESLPNQVPSWVERYKVKYSTDGYNWNPILDDFGKEMIFMGNLNGHTIKANYFPRPIRAKSLRISFEKWHENIVLSMDVMGCKQPETGDEIPELPPDYTVTPIPGHDITLGTTPFDWWTTFDYDHSTPKTTTSTGDDIGSTELIYHNLCRGAKFDERTSTCNNNEKWDGTKCVLDSECPCFHNGIPYPTGAVYQTEKCEECVCRLFGVPFCTPKVCEDCPEGLRKVLTPQCGCTCEKCPEGTRLCPTSDTCVKESSWCDGIQDCPDDEAYCYSLTTTTKKPTSDQCQTSCPAGYQVVFTKNFFDDSEVNNMLGRPTKNKKTKKTKNSVKTYRRPKKTKKFIKPEILSECPPYECVPLTENQAECDPPVCPPEHSVKYAYKVSYSSEPLCPQYSCLPLWHDNCTVSNKQIKTFDGTTYKYDICDHVLVTDESGFWNISRVKECNENVGCEHIVVIYHDELQFKFFPEYQIIELDSYFYDKEQMALLSSHDFYVYTVGEKLVFHSRIYGFEIEMDRNGKIRIKVLKKLKGALKGLCGFYNGEKYDDATLPDGTITTSNVEFVNSWKNPGGKECVETQCSSENHETIDQICSIFREEQFRECQKITNTELCMENVCDCLKNNKTEEECRCAQLAEFFSNCQLPKFVDWRAEYNCQPKCPENLVHMDCHPVACENTCESKNECESESYECQSGCFCPHGLVREGDRCIEKKQCRDCECSSAGFSIYFTFNGVVQFNGNCTYVAARYKDRSHPRYFEILITNSLCGESKVFTCTTEMEIIGPKHSLKLIATPNEEEKYKVMVDGVESNHKNLKKVRPWANLKFDLKHSEVIVELSSYVTVHYSYDKYTFSINLPSHYYANQTEGLCGNCGSNEEPDWEVEKWQVTGGDCLIESPQTCKLSPEEEAFCTQMSDPNIFGKCLAYNDPTPFIDQCFEALCYNGDPCSIIEAFSKDCGEVGICVNWRSHDVCPYTCPPGLEYQPCKKGCYATCEDLKEKTDFCGHALFEGCFCPNDMVLLNGTCVPKEHCEYCDGSHYEGEVWAVDQCSNCTCKNKSITCETLYCPDIIPNCRDDQIPVEEEFRSECCPQYKCVCKECPPVEVPEHIPLGMEIVYTEIGCCERPELVCYKENCPKLEPCGPYYEEKIINSTDCCPNRICEKPPNLCFYDAKIVEEEEEEYEGEQRVNKRETLVVKEIGETWSVGLCKVCQCVDTNGFAEVVCSVMNCINQKELLDYEDYVFEEVLHPDKCCPEFVKRECKEDTKVYQVGDSWLPDESRPCEFVKCVQQSNGGIIKKAVLEICNDECDFGWQYKNIEGKCCGHCEQIGCVVGDKIYLEGEAWAKDDCTHNECVKENGTFSVVSTKPSCPSIENCPEEDIYEENCCLRCRSAPESKRTCSPEIVDPASTVQMIQKDLGKHGICSNRYPLQNFTSCSGHCDSFTQYNPDTFKHEGICKCCQPDNFVDILVELTCEDGVQQKTEVPIPSSCSCIPCGG